MAAADPRAGLQEEATCSICRELYTDPVTLDCGHNFCLLCFNKFRKREDLENACPECRELFDPEKEMKPNKRLANIAEMLKEPQKAPGSLCEEHGEKLQFLCEAVAELLCKDSRESRAHKEHRVTLMKEAEQKHKDVRSTLKRCEKGNIQCAEQEMTKRKEKKTNIEIVKTQKPEEEINKYKGTRELRIVLVGKTGAGKSATGNTILGRREFESRPCTSAAAVASGCKEGSCVRNGHRIVVVDTPGLFDPVIPNSVVAREIAECAVLAAPGPHAFVLVIQTGRFTDEDAMAVEDIQTLFGERAARYTLVLFTRMDDLEEEGFTLEEYIRTADKKLQQVLRSCEGRYLGFNNRAQGAEREQQARALISMVQGMVEDNGGSCYTNQMFQKAEEDIRRREEEIKKERAGSGQTNEGLLTPREEAKRSVRSRGGALEVLRSAGATGAGAALLLDSIRMKLNEMFS